MIAVLAICSFQIGRLSLTVVPIKLDSDGTTIRSRLRIADSTGVRFTRDCDYLLSPTLDSKKQNVAFAEGFTVFIWNKSKGLRRFRVPKLPNGGEGVYEQGGLIWSPNSKRLMVWEPDTQGSMILGVGHLFVLNPATGTWRSIDGGTSGLKWVNHQRIEYRQIQVDERGATYHKVYRLDVLDPKSKPILSRSGRGPSRRHDTTQARSGP